jgi:hypothetical protein
MGPRPIAYGHCEPLYLADTACLRYFTVSFSVPAAQLSSSKSYFNFIYSIAVLIV